MKLESPGGLGKTLISGPWFSRSRVGSENLQSYHILRWYYWSGDHTLRHAVLLWVSTLSLSLNSSLHLQLLLLCFWSSVHSNATNSIKYCKTHPACVTCFFSSQQSQHLLSFLSCHLPHSTLQWGIWKCLIVNMKLHFLRTSSLNFLEHLSKMVGTE